MADDVSGFLFLSALCLGIQGLIVWMYSRIPEMRDNTKAVFITNAVLFSIVCLSLLLCLGKENKTKYFGANVSAILLVLLFSFWISSLFYRGWKKNKNYFDWKHWEGIIVMVLVILCLIVPFVASSGFRRVY